MRGVDTCSAKDGVMPRGTPLHKKTIRERLMKHIVILANGCWQWTANTSPKGYGMIGVDHKQKYAHRVSYEEHVGPIPEGAEVDHTCHDPRECRGGVTCPHRRCINPDHLEPVTPSVNRLRGYSVNRAKTSCPKGHEYTPENTRRHREMRYCIACGRSRRAA